MNKILSKKIGTAIEFPVSHKCVIFKLQSNALWSLTSSFFKIVMNQTATAMETLAPPETKPRIPTINMARPIPDDP